MKKFAKEDFLRNKENKIKTLISCGDRLYVNAYKFLYNHYFLKALSDGSPMLAVFEAIYIDKLSFPAWKLAIHCHVSRTSLFNYRNEIVNNFYTCLENSFPLPEIVFTRG